MVFAMFKGHYGGSRSVLLGVAGRVCVREGSVECVVSKVVVKMSEDGAMV